MSGILLECATCGALYPVPEDGKGCPACEVDIQDLEALYSLEDGRDHVHTDR